MSWPSWMSSAIRSSSWPTDPFSPPARWPSCGTAATSWRPTLSADSAARPADSRALPTDGTAALRADGITAGYGGDPAIRDVRLLGEPPASLAPAIAHSLLSEHVRQLAEQGAAVLIVEQRARAVLAVSDHTYVMTGGELRMQGTPAELSDSPDFVRSFLGGRPGEDPPVSVRKGG